MYMTPINPKTIEGLLPVPTYSWYKQVCPKTTVTYDNFPQLQNRPGINKKDILLQHTDNFKWSKQKQ